MKNEKRRKNKIMKGKLYSGIICAGIILLCGIGSVLADSRATGGLVNLAKNGKASMEMKDCTYKYYFGSAKATNQPASGTFLAWEMNNTGFLNTSNIITDYIVSLSTDRYSHTSSWSYSKTGTYKFIFTAKDGSYYGNVQTTNQTTQAIGF